MNLRAVGVRSITPSTAENTTADNATAEALELLNQSAQRLEAIVFDLDLPPSTNVDATGTYTEIS